MPSSPPRAVGRTPLRDPHQSRISHDRNSDIPRNLIIFELSGMFSRSACLTVSCMLISDRCSLQSTQVAVRYLGAEGHSMELKAPKADLPFGNMPTRLKIMR